MKKLSVLAFALVMAVSGSVFADTLGADTVVDGTKHAAGSHGSETISHHTFDKAVNVNGTSYPAGTKFNVIRLDNGSLVPTHVTNAAGVTTPISAGSAAGGVATGTAATGTTVTGGTVVGGGITTTTAAIGAGVAGVASVIAGNTTTTHHP